MSTIDDTVTLPDDIGRAPVAIQERYVALLADGVSPSLAEMFALRSAPRIMTDSVYFADFGSLDKQFEGAPCGQLDSLIAAAKSFGYTPGRNDVYDGHLAPEFGHPLGFIPPTGGRNHIKRVGEFLDVDMHSDGPVANKRQRHGDTLEVARPRLAPDLAAEMAARMVAENPELKFTTDPRDLLAEAERRHGYDDSKRAGEASETIFQPVAKD